MDITPHGITDKKTNPAFLDDAEILVKQLRKLSIPELKKLMKVSDKLAEVNVERYAVWTKNIPAGQGNHALLSYSGEVFNGLQARSMDEASLLFAQDNVRILSGLYGVLRPLDLIMQYRLEIGAGMKNPRGKNLYDFWNAVIPSAIERLTAASPGKTLVNLASNEYFTAIRPKSFPHRIITPVFKEHDSQGYRNVTIYAKKARGMMLRFIIENRIMSPEDLKAFDSDSYYFNSDKSSENEWWFTR